MVAQQTTTSDERIVNTDGGGEATTDPVEALETEPIVEVFSNPACVRIMVALIDAGPNQDHAPGDIVDMAHIGRRTWYTNVDVLLEHGLVEKTRESGNSAMYAANWGSEPVKAFIHLYDALGTYEDGAVDGDGPDE